MTRGSRAGARHVAGSIPISELSFSRASTPRIPEAWNGRRPGRRAAATARGWRLLALLAILGWVFIRTTPAAGADARPDPRPDGQLRPDLLYHNYCSVCHGDRGDGRSRARGSLIPPPKDFTGEEARRTLTHERIAAAIAAGRPGTAMTGWSTQLDAREIAALAGYIRETFMLPRDTESFASGKALYREHCANCHGDRGQGASGGDGRGRIGELSTPDVSARLGRVRLLDVIRDGKPGTAMPPFGDRMQPAQIEALAAYVRTALLLATPLDVSGTTAHARGLPGTSAAVPSPSPAPVQRADLTLPLPAGLSGDPARGKRFYNANCATCHGVRGDGQGPRAYFINPKPRVFDSEASRGSLNRPAIFAGVSMGRPGTEMPAWSKVLDEQQIADVAEYVFQAFVATTAPSGAVLQLPARQPAQRP